jgi:hypothetical protein
MQRRSLPLSFSGRATYSRFLDSLLLRFSLWEGNVYKQIRMVVLLALALTMSGCGSGSGPGSGNINGTWVAILNNANGSPAYSFSTTFTQGSGSTLSITNFAFTVPGPCFESYQGDQYSEAGSFTLSGNSNGNIAGTFGMTISTIFPTTNNVLTLNGTVNGDTISGTWSATGLQGCSGNGKFTIHGLPPV